MSVQNLSFLACQEVVEKFVVVVVVLVGGGGWLRVTSVLNFDFFTPIPEINISIWYWYEFRVTVSV